MPRVKREAKTQNLRCGKRKYYVLTISFSSDLAREVVQQYMSVRLNGPHFDFDGSIDETVMDDFDAYKNEIIRRMKEITKLESEIDTNS